MRDPNNLHPTRIVDKNGKHTTVYRRTDRKNGASISFAKPQFPIDPKRVEQETAIRQAAREVNYESGFQRIPEIALSRSIKISSDAEVELIANALGMDGFKEMLTNAVIAPQDTANIAVVYDPDIAMVDQGTNARIGEYLRAIKLAHNYMRGPSESMWNLSGESEETRARVKRYVAVFITVNTGSMNTPSNDMMDRALNADEKEYDILLRVLRENKSATLEQVEFIIRGGPTAISAGAL